MDRELDLRLNEIRGRISQADPLLVRLLNFATHFANPFQYGLVLILDGVTVMGTPGPSTSTGEILDRQTVRYFRSIYSQAKRADEAQAKVYEKMGSAVINDLTELLDRPDNLADEAVEAFIPPKAFTLINASMLQVNSNTWQSVPNMRVSISAVRAWWTFDLGVPDQVKEILAQLEAEADG
jgi:hypothetical protein